MSNTNRAIRFGAFLLAACHAAGPATCDTLEVPGQYASIQEAVDASTRGDTVLVASGTYDPAADILIEGKWNLAVIGAEWYDRQVVNASFRLIDSDGMLLERFTIQGAVTVSCNEGTVIRDCEISGSGGAGVTIAGCPGGAYSEVHVIGCRIVGNAGAGIEAELSGGQASFSGNSIRGNGGRGIWILHSYGSVSGNTIHHNGSDGVRIEDASFAVSQNTIAYNSSYGIRIVSGIGSLTQQIHHNAVASNAGVGISSSYGPNIELECNDVWGNGPSGLENYGGALGDQTGISGNISLDPLFCDPPAGNLRAAANSPLLFPSCGAMGAYQTAGCEAIGTRERSWGEIKSLYR